MLRKVPKFELSPLSVVLKSRRKECGDFVVVDADNGIVQVVKRRASVRP